MEKRDSHEYSSNESLIEDRPDIDIDLHLPRRQTSFLRRACGLQSPWRWALDASSVLVIVFLLVQRCRDLAGPGRLQVAGDLTGWTPDFSTQIVKFEPDLDFVPMNASQFFSAETKQKWLDLVPMGLGYQVIPEPEKLDNLPTPLPQFLPRTVFTTSMTHQLHCLYALAETYAIYSSGDLPNVETETPWHMAHCVDYLRQAIMCAGDVALEGTQTTFPDGFEGSDGWDARHVCRDYDQVYRHLEEKRATEDKWI